MANETGQNPISSAKHDLVRRVRDTLNKDWVKNLALGSVFPLGLGLKLQSENNDNWDSLGTMFAGLSLVVALNFGYNWASTKEYKTNNDQYTIKALPHRPVPQIGGRVLDIMTYMSPLGKLIQRACTDDATLIKVGDVKYKVNTGRLTGFDKEKGYFLDTLQLQNAGIRRIVKQKKDDYFLSEYKRVRTYASRETSTRAYNRYNRLAERTYSKEILPDNSNIEKIMDNQNRLNMLQNAILTNEATLKKFQEEVSKAMNAVIQKYNIEYHKVKSNMDKQREQLKASAEYYKLRDQVKKRD